MSEFLIYELSKKISKIRNDYLTDAMGFCRFVIVFVINQEDNKYQ